MIFYLWLQEVVSKPLFPIMVFIVVSIVIALVLTFVEIRLKRKVAEMENLPEKKYLEQIKNLKSKNGKEKLEEINVVAKEFFKEILNLSPHLNYTDLIIELVKKKKPEYIDFCQEMINAYYIDREITDNEVENIKIIFQSLLEKRIAKEEKEIKKFEKQAEIFVSSEKSVVKKKKKVKLKKKVVKRKTTSKKSVKKKKIRKKARK
jgi:hypothetical protein